MPRFFFDVECEKSLTGRVNALRPDLPSAEQYAIGFANTLMGVSESEEKPWRVSMRIDGSKVIQVVAPDRS